MSDLDIDVELLISMVEQRSVLWDRTLDIYKDKNLTLSAWKEICATVKEDFESLNEYEKIELVKSVIKKWTNIRDNWMKWNKKQSEQKKSGCRGKTVRKYIYHDQMKFLKKVAVHGQTVSSVSEEETTNISEQSRMELQSFVEKKRKRTPDEVDLRLRKVRDCEKEPNRHLSFFKGILPSVNNFEEDQTIEFQMGVLLLIRNIKNRCTVNPQTVPPQLHAHNNLS